MKNVTSDFKRDIKKPSRTISVEVTIGSTVYNADSIKSLSVSSSIQSSDGYAVGATEAKTLSLEVKLSATVAYTDEINVRFGLLVERDNGQTVTKEVEWVQYGKFYIDEISTDGYNTCTIKAYDAMVKTDVYLPDSCMGCQNLYQLSEMVRTLTGLSFSTTTPQTAITPLTEVITARSAIAYIASCLGGNAVIGASGTTIDIIIPSSVINSEITGSQYFTLSGEENTSKIKTLICEVNNETTLEVTSPDSGNVSLTITVPIMTVGIMNSIITVIDDVTIRGFSLEAQGDFSVEPGDLIKVYDIFGGQWGLTVTQVDFTYSGSVRMTLSAKGLSEDNNSFSAGGSSSVAGEITRMARDFTTKTEAIYANRVYLSESAFDLDYDFNNLEDRVRLLEEGGVPATALIPTQETINAYIAIGYVDDDE